VVTITPKKFFQKNKREDDNGASLKLRRNTNVLLVYHFSASYDVR
jgi:hypothetical protein